MLNVENSEEGREFRPDFEKRGGLLPCVAQDAETGDILMLAYVNHAALTRTLKTGIATFYSTSRQAIWVKGETSGNALRVRRILVDCDQDSFVYQVELSGDGACHTKDGRGKTRYSCFYRQLTGDGLEYLAERDSGGGANADE